MGTRAFPGKREEAYRAGITPRMLSGTLDSSKLGARLEVLITSGELEETVAWRTERAGSYDCGTMWGWIRRPTREGFPRGFRVQRIGVAIAKDLASLPAAEISRRFRDWPWIAKDLLNESYDKRYTPSTFIKENEDGFSVGWFSSKLGCECVKEFSNLADAATDYLLFSRGKGRWIPPDN